MYLYLQEPSEGASCSKHIHQGLCHKYSLPQLGHCSASISHVDMPLLKAVTWHSLLTVMFPGMGLRGSRQLALYPSPQEDCLAATYSEGSGSAAIETALVVEHSLTLACG